VQVEQQDVAGRVCQGGGDVVGAVNICDQLDVGLLPKQCVHAFAEECVVVGNRNA
jgi:hypothetical protein